MNKRSLISFIFGLGLLVPLYSFALTCSETAKSLVGNTDYNNQKPETLKDLTKLTAALGAGDKKTVTEQTYIWKKPKGTYTIVVRDGVTVSVVDEGIHPDFGRRKFPTLLQATKQLGKPETSEPTPIIKTVWICKDTPSMISLYSDKAGNIISHTGKYCPSPLFAEDCTTFGE